MPFELLTVSQMFRAAVLALCLGSAAAFVAPAPVKSSVTMAAKKAKAAAPAMVSNDYSTELGVLPPVGFWDPAGLSGGVDRETFDRWRMLEIKHGRISMLAVLGYLVPEVFRFGGDIAPGTSSCVLFFALTHSSHFQSKTDSNCFIISGLKFADVPHGIQALDSVPSFGVIQMIFLIGSVDYWGVFGDYDVGKIGSSISQGGILDLDEEQEFARKTQEIQHGRLAMLAFLELLRHDYLNYTTGNDLEHFIIGLPKPF